MALDLYSPCPCGSGKKFKWCCQPIHVELDKAFRQDEAGQHEAALQSIDQVVAAHSGNPEVWGRKAELLYRNNRPEEAEAALQKAFDINPNYPFGHLLRGTFRYEEGELPGALLLFRRAADAYSPEAGEHLANVYTYIADCEMKLNRPVAAQTALRLAIHFAPASTDLRQAKDSYFGDKSRFPSSACREYSYLAPAADLPNERREFWNRALNQASTGKLTDAARAFDQIAQADPNNAAAWYNLGLTRAWLGDHAGALDALDHYVNLETDESKAAAAWTLGEVLRLGHGMMPFSDYVEFSEIFQIRDPQSISAILQQWQAEGRLLVAQPHENDPIFSGLILERQPSLTINPTGTPPPGLGAYLVIMADRLRIWNTNREALDRVREELQQRAGIGLTNGTLLETPAAFTDVLSQASVFPVAAIHKGFEDRLILQHFENYFLEKWIHRPLKSLGGVSPVDAAGHGGLRKKLLGVIQFLEECGQQAKEPFSFDRLRRKLGLGEGPAATPADAGPDIRGMSAAELAGLAVPSLSEDQLQQAYQAALQLDAKELAGKFAKALVALPPPAKSDRFSCYAHLVSLALAEGDSDMALKYLVEGEKADAEQNQGRRLDDYESRRARIHAQRGETDQARQIFERLIERSPTELRYRGAAAEAMLSARQGTHALRFAEGGLAKAREQNNRDSEQYFLELTVAARKQTGG